MLESHARHAEWYNLNETIAAGCAHSAGNLVRRSGGRKKHYLVGLRKKGFTSNGWIAPRVFVLGNAQSRTAMINDGHIHTLAG
ncbi:hypothetical protein [Leisingera methylohalidivorans]|uniref:hypothetical protein n=1 Tax=Leisingera methylohalidivorans TaxID=133924 RepID=UPI0012EB5ACA|nr:hypothetical protein [Leisingera methylohalidivorans]